ncbi:hypothetical protein [Anaplasma marginale]|uniref:hypothetical protein n=1 Tax=Anaplasma marginale TaxID=770 RepID=UPI0018E9FDA6|nr:hypothetical protein [Anaplasma marginale]
MLSKRGRMAHQNSPINCTTTELEKEAIARFRSIATYIPQDCKIYREPWNRSTVLCLDFAACPHLLENITKKSNLLVVAAKELGLAGSAIFKIGNSVRGWTRAIASK